MSALTGFCACLDVIDFFLKFSQNALVLGGRISGEASLENARNIALLTDGAIREIRNPLSGIIVARKIGRIVFDNGKPPDVIIISESVDEGAAYADRIEAGCVPAASFELGPALKALQALSDAVRRDKQEK